jgi:DNA-binding transcriptional LysR family regulator
VEALALNLPVRDGRKKRIDFACIVRFSETKADRARAAMTLKQLEAFYWAATCASFAVAAQRLHLSLSSLSKRIAELEDSLGEPLFDRTGHRAALTDAGSRLVPRVQELLQAADRLKLEVRPAGRLHGVCRFGVGELSAITWLPRLVAAMLEEHPGLTPEPHVDIGEVLERRVEAGELDFAIVAGRSSRSGIASQPIAQARFTWCVAARLAPRSRTLTAAMFEQWPLVTLPAGAGTTRILDDWLAAHGAQPLVHRRITCNHWGAVAGMLADGIGLGLLPEGVAKALQQRGLLRSLRSEPALAPLPYSYQWRRDDSRPLVALMRQCARKTADFSGPGTLF